jgi:hypothetical protein
MQKTISIIVAATVLFEYFILSLSSDNEPPFCPPSTKPIYDTIKSRRKKLKSIEKSEWTCQPLNNTDASSYLTSKLQRSVIHPAPD